MKWFSAASDASDTQQALEAATQNLRGQLDGYAPDLLLAFVSHHHLFHFGRVVPHLQEHVKPRFLMGCSAGAVIGGGVEIESRPGLTLTAATLPDVEANLVHIRNDDLPELDGSPQPWRDLVGADPEQAPQLIVLGDPFSLDVGRLLSGLDYAYPHAPKIGGVASGAQFPGGNALFRAEGVEREGALVLSMWGNVQIDTVVSQGCRPVGKPARVTACEGNLLKELDGESPVKALQSLYESLDDREQELARTALFLGIVMDSSRQEIRPGDFLVRNILGMHRDSGVVAVSAQLRAGQMVQFHLRDGRAAAEDLTTMLGSYQRERDDRNPAGALLFSCLGRGESLFGEPDHDTRRFREEVAAVPVGGFFCNGEIGPVGGSTYLHGYTSAFGIFRPKDSSPPVE